MHSKGKLVQTENSEAERMSELHVSIVFALSMFGINNVRVEVFPKRNFWGYQ